MLRTLILMMIASLTAGVAQAEKLTPDDLQIETLRLTLVETDYRNEIHYTLKLTNHSDQAIGGIDLDLELWAEGRPFPIDSIGVFELLEIPGGMLAGESITMTANIYMNQLMERLPLSEEELSLKHRLEDIFGHNNQSIFCPLGCNEESAAAVTPSEEPAANPVAAIVTLPIEDPNQN